MNRYLNELRKRIEKQLPKEKCNNVMEYYTEYFIDAEFKNEDEVVREFGTPEVLAKKIIEESKGKQSENIDIVQKGEKKGISIGWVIFIAIIGSPLWLGLFCAAFGILVAAFALIITFCAVGAAGIIGAICIIVGGISVMFSDMALGILITGYGFLFGAVGCGLLMLMALIAQSISKLFKRLRNRRKEKNIEGVV